MDSLSDSRDFTDLVDIYKYMNNLYKIPADHFFAKPTRSLRGHSQKLQVQFSHTDVMNNFFTNRAIAKWKTLPDDTVQAENITDTRLG